MWGDKPDGNNGADGTPGARALLLQGAKGYAVIGCRANRDIAENLVLSTRTVEHHVARVMRKQPAASRGDIALP